MKIESNNKTIYGVLIRINRECQNINLKTLSEISGISIGQLSKIERGIEIGTKDTLQYLFEALDIDFNDLKKEINNISTIFNKFYESIYYVEPKDVSKSLLDEINNEYHLKFQTIETLLANLIYNLTYEIELTEAWNIINLLTNVLDYMSLFHKQLFYDYCGVYFRNNRRIDKSIYYLKLSLEINANSMVTAMAYYHLGISYRKNRQVLRAYDCMNYSKNMFFSKNNYKRSTMVDLVIANIHSANNEYSEALNLLNDCLINYKRIDVSLKEIAKIYENMIWINILSENYDEANKIVKSLDNNITNILDKDDTYVLYRIILYVHFKKSEEALILCKKIKLNFHNDNIDHNFIMYYYYLLKDNKAKRLKYLNRIKVLIEQSSSFIEYRWLFKLLDKECVTNIQLIEFKNLLIKYIFNSFD